MERNNWVGVCCKPTLQIIAIRYNDVRDGTNKIGDVLANYRKAWNEKGIVSPSGLYVDWLFLKQDRAAPPTGIGFSAWANAFIDSLNFEFVNSLYEKQTLGYITGIDGEVQLHKLAEAAKQPAAAFPFRKPSLGYVVQWLTELGKETELQGLLQHAENFLRLSWENGGLFYSRNDVQGDNEANAHMDPYTGNAGIAYARLNVKDRQKIMWEKPWTRENLAKQPCIDGIDLSQDIDCLRSIWDGEKQVLVVALKAWDSSNVDIGITAKSLTSGVWAVYIDGELAKTYIVEQHSLTVKATVVSKEVDFFF
ncbi:hypothetical protein EDB81DRAFT_848985 [Dactylonectria macrodidyma]|uniref:Linalool dehydratase/isomerase domain-containing protein n=1 Tax=Dactylonectria macrodidyma TaxID=307937 RepID=A0A9P9I9L1_9HYPO|nr:hypothetical protein EDB81DRAFT_848985 [Dactylonectria macrodidyma]